MNELPTSDDKFHVIGPDDGQQKIVQVARKICNDVKNNQMSHSDIDIQFVDALIQGTLINSTSAVMFTICLKLLMTENLKDMPNFIAQK